MTLDQAFETLIGQADPALTAAWAAFIRAQDARYGRLAAERGEPYSPFTDDEVREVARLAAALGAAPGEAPAREAPEVTRERVLVGAR